MLGTVRPVSGTVSECWGLSVSVGNCQTSECQGVSECWGLSEQRVLGTVSECQGLSVSVRDCQ